MTADRKRELVERDDASWAELHALIDPLTREELERIGYQEDWSIKDLLAHLGCWYAETAMILEQMRMGTFTGEEVDTERLNREWAEAWRDQELPVVLSELNAARWRTLEQWNRLPEVTPQADEWFRETSYEHYDDHLPRLREWVGEMRRT